ncbi:MAG: DNA primase [Anaerolineae bacterium]|nr:DNA primase [Anaerolineae bacterium]MCX8067143.1 DNA primase [Anaerolineae bacterium]MDW7991938.1 DNA primase [Anaerolineae bacterium]
MGVVDEIKERLDIVEVISSYVPLQRAGRYYRALCPFHTEKTPSFYVFPDSQRWHCFGACGEGGDVFTFVMKKEGWDFATALQELARRAGVSLRPRTPEETQQEEERARLEAVIAEAVRYYHHLLLHAPEAALAREYIARRGLSTETVERFQLGYSLPSWESLRTYLTSRGFTVEELVRAGLLVEQEDGTAYDRFRDRLMIPIRDPQGRPVGFGARTLQPDGVPKYINSPQTVLFDKSRLLFGLDLARDAIRQEGAVVIVEGYMDVMQAHQAGFRNVVAQMGTALTEPQVRLLKRYASRFILALDPDAAGVQATLRGLETARQALDRELEPVFNPRGLVGFERRLGAEIRVLSLPAGCDPDDLIRSDPDRWRALVQEAIPVVEFYLRLLLTRANLEDAKERARVVETVLPLLRDVGNPVERETYVQKLARAVRVDVRTILERLHELERQQALRVTVVTGPTQRTAPRSPVEFRRPSIADLEGYALALFLHQPQLLGAVNQALAEMEIPPLSDQDFADPTSRAIFDLWEEQLAEGNPDPSHLKAYLPEPLLARLETLPAPPQDLTDEQWLREGVQTALRLRERRLRSLKTELRALTEEASGPDADRYGQALAENARAILRVQQALRYRPWEYSPESGSLQTPDAHFGL